MSKSVFNVKAKNVFNTLKKIYKLKNEKKLILLILSEKKYGKK